MVLLRNCGLVILFSLISAVGFGDEAGYQTVVNSEGQIEVIRDPAQAVSAPVSGGTPAAASGAMSPTDQAATAAGGVCQSAPTTDTQSAADVTACKSAQSTASSTCLESLSPNIQGAVAVIGGLMSAAQGMGLVEACSKQQQAMDIAKNAMLAYNLACGAMMMKCESACEKATKSVTADIKVQDGLICTATTAPSVAAKAEKDKAILQGKVQPAITANGCISACSAYKKNLAAGAMGLLQLVARMGQANNCKDKTQTAATETPIDCKIAANKTTTKCICEEKPLSQGCPGAQQSQFANGGINTTTTGEPATTTSLNDPNLQLNKDLSGPMALGSQSGGTNSGNGAGGAAGGAGSGGGSSAAKGADGAKGAQKAGLNPNILGGDFGGGGGGSRGGGGGSDRDNSPYKPYMPGGSKDPAARGTASSAVEVTGAGGVDNWTKVNRVYQEARPTLMGK